MDNEDQPIRNNKGQFKPGHSGNPKGKPKGATSPKKIFIETFDKLGGMPGLVKWAKKSNSNMKIFYQLYARMIPPGADGPPEHGRFELVFIDRSKEGKKDDSDKPDSSDGAAATPKADTVAS